MTDLFVNRFFDVELDDRNDVRTVDGRAKFEQSVAIYLTDYMYDITGDVDISVLKERIRLQVSRVENNHQMIESIDLVNIGETPGDAGTIGVEIVYESDETFDFELNL